MGLKQRLSRLSRLFDAEEKRRSDSIDASNAQERTGRSLHRLPQSDRHATLPTRHATDTRRHRHRSYPHHSCTVHVTGSTNWTHAWITAMSATVMLVTANMKLLTYGTACTLLTYSTFPGILVCLKAGASPGMM
jgi:hypothetical protein